MANSDKNIRITTNKDTTSLPKIVFTGQSNNPITLNVLDDNTISFEGSAGQLFSINNNLSSGYIFSINDISGIPSFRVNADGTVGIAEFLGNVGIGLTNPAYKLQISGSAGISGTANISGVLTLSSTTGSGSTSTGALVVSGGVGIGGSIFSSSAYASNISGVVFNNGAITNTGTITSTGVMTISNSSATAFAVRDGSNSSKFNVDTVGGIISVLSSTASTNSSTGALVVSGGVGIGGSLYVASATAISGVTINAGVITGSLTGTATTATYSHQSGYAITTGSSGTATTANYAHQSGYAITSGSSATASTATYSHQSGYATTSGLATTATYSYQSGYATTSGLATTSTYSHQSGYAITSGTATTATYAFQSGYGITAGLATTATYAHQSGYAITSGSSGSATTANNINVVNALSNSAHTLLFSPTATGSGVAVSSNTTLSYNPSSFVLSTSGLAITATTVSSSTSNGALQVAGGVGISGRLSFNQAAFGTTGIATNPTMAMIGNTGDPIFLSILEDNTISFEGSQGQLFSITPNLSTGYIYSVNDITGIPLLRANANANVTANEYAGNFGIGLSNPGYKLHVVGSVGFTSTTASTSTTTGTLVVSGGVGIGGSLYVNSPSNISSVIINNGVITGNLTGTATTSGFATTASYSNQAGYAITAGSATTATYSHQAGYAITAGSATTAVTAVSTTSVSVASAGNSNLAHPILITNNPSSGSAVSSDSTFTFNPSTEILSVSGISITSSTGSSNTTTGALIVTGGVGIGGSLNVGNKTRFNDEVYINSFSSNALTVGGSGSVSYTWSVGTTLTANRFNLGSDLSLSPVGGSQSVVQSYWGLQLTGNTLVTPNSFSPTSYGARDAIGVLVPNQQAGRVAFGIIAHASQTADLQIWTSSTASTSSPYLAVKADGQIYSYANIPATSFSSGALVVSGGVGIGGSLFVNGDLTINGTTTTINSVTISVDDKNIELGSVSSPSDLTAEGGGITLKGATDKFINWYSGVGWSSSESWNLVSGNSYKINNASVLTSTTLGTGVTNSSLTSLGTITTGVWAGTLITAQYGGVGLTTPFTVGDILYANTSTTWGRLTAGTSGHLLSSTGTGSTPSYVNPNTLTVGSATTASNLRIASAGSSNLSHSVLFTPSSSTSGSAVSSDSTFTFNSSTEILSVSGIAVTSTTASSGSTTGALTVSGGVGIGGTVNIAGDETVLGRLYYSQSTVGVAGTSTIPSISFIGQDNNPITLSVLTDNTLSFEGSSGQLFSINNNLSSGTIFSVNDISGIPIIRANANGTLSMGEFTGTVGVGLTNPSFKFHVSGSAGFSGTIYATGNVSLASNTASTSTANGALTVAGGVGIGGSLYVASATAISGVNINAGVITGSLTGTASTATYSHQSGYAITSGSSGAATTATYSYQSGYGITAGLATTAIYSYQSGYATTSGFATTATYSHQSGYAITSGSATSATSASIANTSSSVSVNSASANSSHYLIFSPNATGSGIALSTESALVYNPSTDILSVSGISITSSTGSGSTSTGALVISGGVGIGQSLFTSPSYSSSISGAIFNNGSATLSGSFTQNNSSTTAFQVRDGSNSTKLNVDTIGGIVSVSSSTASTSTSTGALVVTGGVGIGGSLFVGNTLSVASSTASTSTTTGALIVSGGVGISGSINASDVVRSGQLIAPTFTLSALGNTGALSPSTTYYYKLSALDYFGNESLPSSEVSITLNSSTYAVNINPNIDQSIYAIKIYRTTTSNSYTNSLIDTYYPFRGAYNASTIPYNYYDRGKSTSSSSPVTVSTANRAVLGSSTNSTLGKLNLAGQLLVQSKNASAPSANIGIQLGNYDIAAVKDGLLAYFSSITSATGGTLTAGTRYYYVMTGVDSYGNETFPSKEFPFLADANGAAQLNIAGGDYGIIKYRFYRTTNPGNYTNCYIGELPGYIDINYPTQNASPPTSSSANAYVLKSTPAENIPSYIDSLDVRPGMSGAVRKLADNQYNSLSGIVTSGIAGTLSQNTIYYYKVASYDRYGNTSSASIPYLINTGPATSVQLTPTGMDWPAGVEGYLVYRSTSKDNFTNVPTFYAYPGTAITDIGNYEFISSAPTYNNYLLGNFGGYYYGYANFYVRSLDIAAGGNQSSMNFLSGRSPQPTLSAATGGTLTPGDVYYYKVMAFGRGDDYSMASPAVRFVIGAGGAARISVNSIGITGFRHYNLYRTADLSNWTNSQIARYVSESDFVDIGYPGTSGSPVGHSGSRRGTTATISDGAITALTARINSFTQDIPAPQSISISGTTGGILTTGTTYYYRILPVGVNWTEFGQASKQVIYTTSSSENAISLSWGAVQNATGYRVMRSTTNNAGSGQTYTFVHGTSFVDKGYSSTTHPYDPYALYYPGSYGATFSANLGRYHLPFLNLTNGDSPNLYISLLPPTISSTSTGTGGTLANNTDYYYIIEAFDYNNGSSLPSTEVVVNTGANNSVTLNWNEKNGAFYYKIYRSSNSDFTNKQINQTVYGTTFTDLNYPTVNTSPRYSSTNGSMFRLGSAHNAGVYYGLLSRSVFQATPTTQGAYGTDFSVRVAGRPAGSIYGALFELGDFASTGYNGSSYGTYFGLSSATGFTGNYIDFQLSSISRFKVDYLGNTTIGSTTGSGSTSTGALVISGGVGIGQSLFTSPSYSSSISGAIFSNGSATLSGSFTQNNSSTTAFQVRDGSNNPAFVIDTIGDIISLPVAVASTSTGTGSLVVTGGVGIGGTINIGGRVGIGTNLLTGQINIATSSAATPGIVVRSSTSQTADYAQFFTSTGSTSLSIDKDGRITFPSQSSIQLFAETYSSTGRIRTSGPMIVYGQISSFSDGVNESYFNSGTLYIQGLSWTPYGSPARWSTNNAVRIQPTSTSVVPLVVQLQNASWTSGNAFEIQNNSVLKFNVDYAGNTSIASTTGSGSTTTGALVVTGGVGIGQTLFTSSSYASSVSGVILNAGVITGSLTGTASTATYSHQSGYAITSGTATTATYSYQSGYAITSGLATSSASVYINNANSNANHPLVFTPILGSSSGAGLSTNSTVSFNPSTNYLYTSGLAITASTASTSTSTGALIVTGGVGIGQTLFTSSSYANSLSGVVFNNGVVTSGSWAGSLITAFYGGTGFNSYTKGDILVGAGTTLIKQAVGSQNQILIADLFSGSGLSWATFANPTYGSFYSTIAQPVAGSAVTTPVKFTSTYESNRVSIIGGAGTSSRIQIQDAGPFNIIFSAQLNLALGNQAQKGDFWLRVNGVDVPNTTVEMTVYGKDYQSLATANFVYTFQENSYFEIMFSSDDIHFRLESITGFTTPPRPDMPSALISILPVTHIVGASGSGISGILSLNGSNVSQQYFLTGRSGSDFNIQTGGGNHTFNIPYASTGSTGLVNTLAQSFAGVKTFTNDTVISSSTASTSFSSGALFVAGGVGIGGSLNVNSASSMSGVRIDSGTIYGNLTGLATTASYAYQSGYGITAGLATTANYSYQSGYGITSGLATTSTYAYQSGYAITSGSSGLATTATYSYTSGYGITSGSSGTANTATYAYQSGYAITSGLATTATYAYQSGYAITSGLATTATYSYQAGYGLTAGLATTASYAYQSGYGLTSGLATTSTYSYQSGYGLTSGFATTANYSYQSGYGLTAGLASTATYAYQSGYGLTSGFATTANYAYRSGYGITSGFATTASYAYQSGYGLTSGLATTATYSYTSGYGITAGSSATATTASNINVNNATAASAHFLHFSPSATGSGLATSSNTTLSYNPSTLILSTSGLAVTASTSSTTTSSGALIVTGGAGIGGSLFTSTSNASSISGVILNNGAITNTGTITSTGVMTLSNSSTTAFQVRDGSNNSTLTIDTIGDIVTLPVAVASTTTGTGSLVVAGGVGIGGSASVGGRLQMFNGANYTAFVSSASGNTVYTLPATSPATGTSVLQSTSAGVMTWVPMTAGGGSGTVTTLTAGTGISFSTGSTITTTGTIRAKRPMVASFCAGYTPAASGADSVVIRLPDSPSDGITAITYEPQEFHIRVETPSATTTTIQLEKYTGTGAFSGTAITSVSISGATTYEAQTSIFAAAGTFLTSGDKLKINFTALSASHATFSVYLELEEV